MKTTDFSFLGIYKPFGDGKEGGEVQNEKRTKPKPMQHDKCVFCGLVDDGSVPLQLFQWIGMMYAMFINSNQIVKSQYLTIPASVPCRLGIIAQDVLLMIKLAMHGFDGLAVLPNSNSDISESERVVRRATWANPLPGTSRSVPHLHINSIPHGSVPEANFHLGEFITYGVGETKIHRVQTCCYQALELDGKVEHVAKTVEIIHSWCNEHHVPYNLLCFPGSGEQARVILVPRALEFSPSVKQKLAGLEFYSLCVLPPRELWDQVTPELRDEAFAEATKSDEEFDRFCDLLKRDLPAGPRAAVVAVRPR